MSYCKIQLKDIKKIDFIVTNGMTAKQVYEKYKPDYILNAALYDMSSKTDITNAKDNGKKHGYLFSNEGIAIDNNKISWTNKDQAKNDFIAGAPCLLKDSKKFIDWGNKVSSYVNGIHNRTCFGFNKDSIFLYVSDTNLSIDKTAEECLKLGMQYAINLDGGGSSHLQQGSKVLKQSSRANCSWILVYLNKVQVSTSTPTTNTKLEQVKVICNNKEQAGYIINGVTYVPARFVSENLGAKINWNATTKTVTIKK